MFETLVLYPPSLNITTANFVIMVTASVVPTGLGSPCVCELTLVRRTKWGRIEQPCRGVLLAIIILSLVSLAPLIEIQAHQANDLKTIKL